MRITIDSKYKDTIRNQQAGDWTHNADGSISAFAAIMGNSDYEFLIGIHEAIEAYLCKNRGITDEVVTAFDEKFEKERAAGGHGETDEDGDDPRAPYAREHFFSTNIERQLAHELGVSWSDYEKAIADLFNTAEQTGS